jgi:hypothetical protein
VRLSASLNNVLKAKDNYYYLLRPHTAFPCRRDAPSQYKLDLKVRDFTYKGLHYVSALEVYFIYRSFITYAD